MILVVGATSVLGSRIVHGLLDKGNKVRVLIGRHSQLAMLSGQGAAVTIQSLVNAGAKTAWGDPKSMTSLTAALSDVDTVITVVNTAKHWGFDAIESVDRHGTLNLVDSARNAGVRRFLMVAIPGEGLDNHERTQRLIEEYEQLLERSGMTYTIVLPTVFMEYWIGMMVGIPLMTQQAVTLIGRGDHAHNFISEVDVANYFVAMIHHPKADNRTVAVGGPASYSWTEIVQKVRARIGVELPIQYAMMGTPISYIPEKISPLASEFERFENRRNYSELARTFGVRLTTLDTYIDWAFASRQAEVNFGALL